MSDDDRRLAASGDAGPSDPVPPIHLSRRVRASRLTAWGAITEPELVGRWFARVRPLGKVGDPYRIDFEDGGSIVGTVLANEAGRRFAFSWLREDEPAGSPTRVTWAVEPMSTGGSRIVLEHDGGVDAGWSARDRRDREGQWIACLDKLRALLDGGRPEPPDEVF